MTKCPIQTAEKSAEARGYVTIPNTQSWLKVRLSDKAGDCLMPPQSTKKSDSQEHIIRYYISNRFLKKNEPTGWRLSSRVFMPFVAQQLRKLTEHLTTKDPSNYAKFEVCKQAQSAPSVLAKFIKRIIFSISELKFQQNEAKVSTLWANISNQQNVTLSHKFLSVTSQMAVKRRGVEQKSVSGYFMKEPNPILCKGTRMTPKG